MDQLKQSKITNFFKAGLHDNSQITYNNFTHLYLILYFEISISPFETVKSRPNKFYLVFNTLQKLSFKPYELNYFKFPIFVSGGGCGFHISPTTPKVPRRVPR